MPIGERKLLFRASATGNVADTLVRASDPVGEARDVSTRLSPSVNVIRFAANGAAALLLRTAAFGGGADTDLLGTYYIPSTGGTVELWIDPQLGDVPMTRDLRYIVTAGGGVTHTTEIETEMR